jgi:D-ribose pyranose/furanose isomerase RbsD
LEVCGSRNPVKQEEDIDSAMSNKIPHLNKILRIMVMEVEDLKVVERNAIQKKNVSAQEARGVELVIQSFQAQV